MFSKVFRQKSKSEYYSSFEILIQFVRMFSKVFRQKSKSQYSSRARLRKQICSVVQVRSDNIAGFLKACRGLNNWPIYRLKLDEFWKIQEMLYVIGTEIFQFGPLGAEKFAFKNLTLHFWHMEIIANWMQFCSQVVSWKLGFFGGL